MKNKFLQKWSVLFFLGVLVSLPITLFGVTWDGGLNPPVNVTDMPVVLDGGSGDIELPAGGVSITADTNDVNVTLANGPVRVVGNSAGPSRLYLCASFGQKIIFHVDSNNFDLSFLGSSDGPPKTPLLIVIGGVTSPVFKGAGTIEFRITGGRTLSFIPDATHGSVETYVLMGDPNANPSNSPILLFSRDLGSNLGQNITAVIGTDSLLSYISTANLTGANLEGRVHFDTSNTGAGRMNLDIKNRGGFIISASQVGNVPKTSITRGNIDRKVPAGRTAIAQIINNNNNASGSLLVTSNNNTLFDLLFDPFCNLNTRNDGPNFNGSFSGLRYSMVLGANGILNVMDNAYLDYVGLTCDMCPTVTIEGFDDFAADACLGAENTEQLIKKRNPSAFFVDGNNNPAAIAAAINLNACSAIFFRSGVNDEGVVENDINSVFPFTIDPEKRTKGAGKIVFDVEGLVNITGQNNLTSKLEVLSLFVNPTGGRLFVDNQMCPAIFPLRTFAKDGDQNLRIYNSAAFLINNCMNLFDTSLMHTDQNHQVFQDNDVKSEPTYIGGETFELKENVDRPKIAFNNSRFLVHTNVALTGVDLLVPNTKDGANCENNVSQFIFFQNGKKIDNGTGRFMILGTQPGSTTCNGCNIISRDAHLDVIQKTDCALGANVSHCLELRNAANDGTITEGLTGNVSGEPSIQTIFLGHSSNISIGTNGPPFAPATNPTLKIKGNFFSFETRGGSKGLPATSNVTGEGGIFVDANGRICIGGQYRASMATMVTKSRNGIVDLPKNQVFFDCRIGVADWQLDLSDPMQRMIVDAGECLSDYTLNWLSVKKDYDVFCPYRLDSVNTCTCPAVEQKNVTDLPEVKGEVNQLQIQGSRIGDPAHVKVDCGWVRELIFQKVGNYTAQAPVGVVVLTNNGRVGLGTAQKNPDSLEASIVLGVNGVTVIADGNGVVELNEDLIINNVCALLKGPNFAPGNVLQFNADVPRMIRIKKTGVLDLRTFGANDIVEFNGDIRIILEPGAKVLLNGCTIRMKDLAFFFAEPFVKLATQLNPADGLRSTDDFRVKFIGTGLIEFQDNTGIFIPKNSFVGVETLSTLFTDTCCPPDTLECEIETTDLTFELKDSARFVIGDDDSLGGSFQVGNTENRDGHSVSFTLLMNGTDAIFCVKTCGFWGWGVGIVDKRTDTPNTWLVDNLFNVDKITINLRDGQIKHDRIYPGDDPQASLFAINDASGTYALLLAETPTTIPSRRTRNANINGGGNMLLLSGSGSIAPTIGDDDGIIDSRRTVSILGSSILRALLSFDDVFGLALFAALKTPDLSLLVPVQTTTAANFAPGFGSFRAARVQDRVGYIDRAKIGRENVSDIIGSVALGSASGGTPESRRSRASDIGAVFGTVDTSENPPGSFLIGSEYQ